MWRGAGRGAGGDRAENVTYAIRHGAQSRSTRLRGDLLSVDQLAESLPHLEERHPLFGNADAVPGLGVAALSRVAVADSEAAEPAQLHLISLGESVGDVVEDGVDDQLRLLLGQARQLGNFLDQIRFGHEPAPSTGTSPLPVAEHRRPARFHLLEPSTLVERLSSRARVYGYCMM